MLRTTQNKANMKKSGISLVFGRFLPGVRTILKKYDERDRISKEEFARHNAMAEPIRRDAEMLIAKYKDKSNVYSDLSTPSI